MKVFLSWSGQTSHSIAAKLHKWLPMVIQKVEPYISTEIEKGTRWSTDIAQELEQCSFGIACVTFENKDAPWLLFEAGALSKSVSEGKLAPILFGLEQADIQKSPLTQFQMTKFEKGEISKLLHSINQSCDHSLDDEILNNLFDALWPQLDADISNILSSSVVLPLPQQPLDSNKIMGAMEELLTNSRSVIQAISRPERLIPEEYIEYVFRKTGAFQPKVASSYRHIEMLLIQCREEIDLLRNKNPETKEILEIVLARIDEMRYILIRDRERRQMSPIRGVGTRMVAAERLQKEAEKENNSQKSEE